MKTKSLITKLYAFALFDDLILIYPLYTLLFADSHISPVKISSLLAVWSFTAFLLEVPAGSIADKYPRRNVLLTGILLRAIGYTFWLFMHTYLGFLIGFILWGIKSAFTSGTKEALVYDELVKTDDVHLYTKVMGRMEALSLFAIVLAGIGASLLARHGYTIILVFSILAVLVSAFVVFLLPKAKITKSAVETKLTEYLRSGIKLAVKKPNVLFIIIFTSVMLGLGALDEYDSLFFRAKGLSNASVSIWLSIIVLFGIVGSLMAHRLEHIRLPIIPLVLLLSALLFLATLVPGVFAPLIIGVFALFFYFVKVLFNTYLQQSIEEKTRATVTSVAGMLAELVALTTFAIVGLTAARGYIFSIKVLAGLLGLFGIILIPYYLYLKSRYGYVFQKPAVE